MLNQDDILNFLIWQIKARIPEGSIYKRIREASKNNLTNDDPFYYIYWKDLNRNLLKKYLLGTFKTDSSDYNKFIEWLNTRYAKDNFYEIKIKDGLIRIPCPQFYDYKCFKMEFLDIIMPYIIDDRTLNYPFLEGPYEYHNVVLNNHDIVLDLGANYGLFSSLASAKGCTVYAFEPTPFVISEYLSKLEKTDPNIHIIPKAISNKNDMSLFELNPVHSCNKLVSNFNPKIETTVVKTTTIDDFVSNNNLTRVDFIKSDIEGFERHMLQGAQKTLKEFAPKLAICYYHRLDDLKVLTDLIMNSNPNYEIETSWKKIYARVRRK